MSENSDQHGSLPPVPPPPGDPRFGDWFPLKPKRGAESGYAWQDVWLQAITRPDVVVYRALLRDPQASPHRAYTWIFLGVMIGFVIQGLMAKIFTVNFTQEAYSNLSTVLLIVCAPVAGVLGIIAFLVASAIQQFVAVLLGGTGRFEDLLYLYAAFAIPLTLIQAALALVPCLTWGVVVYGLVLSVIAVEAVNDFGWPKAIISIFWWIPAGCVCGCLLIFLAAIGAN
jgi:hypothetical protein